MKVHLLFKKLITLSLLIGLGVIARAQCDKLFFSEYGESSTEKYLEIYNPTSVSISLNGYEIHRYSNGGSTVAVIALNTANSVPAYGTYVVAGTSNFSGTADETNANLSHNGDDSYVLLDNNNDTLDIIGSLGNSAVFGEDVVLVRNADIQQGVVSNPSSFDMSQWTDLGINVLSNVGMHSSHCALEGGSVMIMGGSSDTTFCLDGTVRNVPVVLSNDTLGDSSQWVITDDAGEIIAFPANPSMVNFDDPGAGVCLIWHLSYYGPLTNLDSGQNISTITGVFDFSDSIRVDRRGVVRDTTMVTICSGDSAELNGTYYMMAGTYSDTMMYADMMCDSTIDVLILMVQSPDGGMISAVSTVPVCQEDQDTVIVSVSGMVGDSSEYLLTNQIGEVLAKQNSDTFDLSSMSGDTVLIWNIAFNPSFGGINVGDTVSNVSGCGEVSDSLYIILLETAYDTIRDTTCNGDSLMFGGVYRTMSGSYNDTVQSSNMCDSVVTLHLLIRDVVRDTTETLICTGDSIMFGGTYYNMSGTYIDTMMYADGKCDSTISTLVLTVSTATGGSITTTDPDTLVCVDGNPKMVAVTLTGNVGDSSQWVVTDEAGVILALPTDVSTVDFDAVGPGVCLIWHLSYNGAPTGITMGQNISGIMGCFDFSDSIRVVRNEANGGAAIIGMLDSIWRGPMITFTKANFADPTQMANQDNMTSNVSITRASSQGIFNAVTENSFSGNSSPAGTEWAFGTTANISSLTFTNWRSAVGFNPPSMVNRDMVVHLIAENIYIDIRFTSWTAGGNGGGFSYQRSTPTYSFGETICIDGSVDTFDFNVGNSVGDSSQWIVTDENGMIVDLPGDPDTINFDLTSPGTSLVWHLSYFGNITGLTVGQNISGLMGCFDLSDSIPIIKNSPSASTIFDSICDGDTYTSPSGMNYTTAGMYMDTIPNAVNCDSVITINLFVRPNTIPGTTITVSPNDTVCFEDIVTFDAMVANLGSDSTNYDWRVNNTMTGETTNQLVADASVVNNNETVTVIVETFSGGFCSRRDTSNAITIVRTPNPIVIATQTGSDITTSVSSVTGSVTYDWMLNGASVGMTDRITPTQNGTYFVTVTDANGCTGMDSIVFDNVGVEELGLSAFVKVYPNPNNGIFTIENNTKSNLTIQVFDNVGRLITNDNITSTNKEFNFSAFEAGTYMIVLTDEKGHRAAKQIIIE